MQLGVGVCYSWQEMSKVVRHPIAAMLALCPGSFVQPQPNSPQRISNRLPQQGHQLGVKPGIFDQPEAIAWRGMRQR